MAYLHTILACPSKTRLNGALNRVYGYLSRYRAGRNGRRNGDIDSSITRALDLQGGSFLYRFQQSSSPV
jgi:hypothetical protein